MAVTAAARAAKRLFVTAQPDPATSTIAQLRRNDDALFESLRAPDIRVEPATGCPVPSDWVSAPGSDGSVTVLYFHGGGYFIGSKEGRHAIAGELSRASGGRVLVVGFRLAPEHPFPAAVEDALAAYEWLREGGTATIVVAGDSAGGGLAAVVAAATRSTPHGPPDGVVLFSPLVDFTVPGASWETNAALDPISPKEMVLWLHELYLAGHDPRDPLVSPLYGELAGLPPILVFVGSEEAMVDDVVRYAELASAAGVDVDLQIYDDMFHIWPAFSPILPEGKQAIEHAGRFLRRIGRGDYAPGSGPSPERIDDEAIYAAIAARHEAVLAVLSPDGFPALTNVVYAWSPAERAFRISTTADRAKVRRLRRDPRCALHIAIDGFESFLVAEGTAEVSEPSLVPGDPVGIELLGLTPQFDNPRDRPAFLKQMVDDHRLVVTIQVDRVYGTALAS